MCCHWRLPGNCCAVASQREIRATVGTTTRQTPERRSSHKGDVLSAWRHVDMKFAHIQPDHSQQNGKVRFVDIDVARQRLLPAKVPGINDGTLIRNGLESGQKVTAKVISRGFVSVEDLCRTQLSEEHPDDANQHESAQHIFLSIDEILATAREQLLLPDTGPEHEFHLLRVRTGGAWHVRGSNAVHARLVQQAPHYA